MNRRLKVMYIIPAEGFGGAERQAIMHIKNLPSYGIDVVTVSGPGKKVIRNVDQTVSKVYDCPFMPYEYGKPFNFFTFLVHLASTIVCWFRTLLFLININKKEQVDLVFGSRVAGWMLASSLARLSGIPCIWRFGSRVNGRLRQLSVKTICFLFKPSAIVTNCEAITQTISALVRCPVQKNLNGIDCTEYDPKNVKKDDRLEYIIKKSTPLVGLAVRPSPDKGMVFLSEIILQLKKNKTNVHFCIAGEFGWRTTIQRFFHEKGISDYVTFTGHIDNIKSFYLCCDIIALTSIEKSIEGFPNSLLEAMAMGRPVIATAVGGVPELINHEKNGLLVKTDPLIFAAEITSLINDPEKRMRLGVDARDSVMSRFSPDNTAGKLSKIIRSIVSSTENDLISGKTS